MRENRTKGNKYPAARKMSPMCGTEDMCGIRFYHLLGEYFLRVLYSSSQISQVSNHISNITRYRFLYFWSIEVNASLVTNEYNRNKFRT